MRASISNDHILATQINYYFLLLLKFISINKNTKRIRVEMIGVPPIIVKSSAIKAFICIPARKHCQFPSIETRRKTALAAFDAIIIG